MIRDTGLFGSAPSNPCPATTAALGLLSLDPEFLALMDETCDMVLSELDTTNQLRQHGIEVGAGSGRTRRPSGGSE